MAEGGVVMPRPRTQETLCEVCDQLVGVWITPWNTGPASTIDGRPIPKTSRHYDPQGRWCRGGQLQVHPSKIIPVGGAL